MRSDSQHDHDPAERLSEAVEAWLTRDPAQSEEEFLRAHEELRDLLEPMIAEGREDDPAEAETHTTSDALPRVLGDYRLLRELGRGGMGIVYEAEEVSLRRRVALKVLRDEASDQPVSIHRLRREAAASARLDHPGIVRVHSVGEVQGTHYCAMELVTGVTLHERLEALRAGTPDLTTGYGGLTLGLPGSYLQQAAVAVAQVCEALEAAHSERVIHRDIKPKNVILDEHGQVRVVDFGLARDLDRATISADGEVVGTPSYMSPEQVRGLAHVDAATDVYAAGVMLYELLTLRCPFDAQTTEAVLLSICRDEPIKVRSLSPTCPQALQVLCELAMEKRPQDRIASAGDFARDLRRYLAGEAIEAQPAGPLRRLGRLARRRKVAVLSGTLAIVLAASASWYFGVYRPTLSSSDHELQTERQHGDSVFEALHGHLVLQLERAADRAETPHNEAAARAILESAIDTLQDLDDLGSRYPQQASLLAWGHRQLAELQIQLGDFAGAERSATESERRYADLAAAHDDGLA